MNRLAIEAIAAVALLIGAVLWWRHHDAAQQAIGRAQVTEAVNARAIEDAGRYKLQQASNETRIATVVEGYEKRLQDQNAALNNLAQRLRDYQTRVRISTVPGGAAITGTVGKSPTLPSSDAAVERATQLLFDACAADAKQLEALQSAWPR